MGAFKIVFTVNNPATGGKYMKIPCVYMRGGTSKGVMFQKKDLPEDKSLWDDIF